MSTRENRSLSGPVNVVPLPKSLAQLLADAGIKVPDQREMRRMMRATVAGLGWEATEEEISAAEAKRTQSESFEAFSLAAYARVASLVMGAPMPRRILRHVGKLQKLFPEAQISVLAHPKDDPFVQVVLHGETCLTMAWRRSAHRVEIYPRTRWFFF